MRLDGRVALVTGVSRRVGIGFAVASQLASLGADVLIHTWRAHDTAQPWGADPLGDAGILADMRSGLSARAGRIEQVSADFLGPDPSIPEQLVEAAHAAFGRLDILVANHARSASQDLWSLTASELEACFAVNVRATLMLVQAFARRHDGRPGGRIILFTSGQYHAPMPNELPYIVSQGALHQVTRSLAAGLARRGILVNCVDPGATDTGYADDAARAALAARHPFARWGEPDDVARLIAWLVSDAGRWIVGQVLTSDGGLSLGGPAS